LTRFLFFQYLDNTLLKRSQKEGFGQMGTVCKKAFMHGINILAALAVAASPAAADPSAASSRPNQADAAAAFPAVQKGLPHLYRLFPPLKGLPYGSVGDVDGPGISGISVHFYRQPDKPESEVAEAIFDPESGALLRFTADQLWKGPANGPSDALAKEKAVTFVQSLDANGKEYVVQGIAHEQETATVRLIRMINGVQLPDNYDCFVTVDGAGNIRQFRTMQQGNFYEKLDARAFPSPENALPKTEAVKRFVANNPLRPAYLLPPGQAGSAGQPQEAKLLYVLQGGILRNFPTGGAIDAVGGQPLPARAKPAAQLLSISGSGEPLKARTPEEAKRLIQQAFQGDPGTLPLTVFEEEQPYGQKVRFYIWGYFDPQLEDFEKRIHIGSYPEALEEAKKAHYLLETDAATGRVLRYAFRHYRDELRLDKKQHQLRDQAAMSNFLKRYLPPGQHQLIVTDLGGAYTSYYVIDPLKDGIPVIREGMMEEEGMYTIGIDSATGKINEASFSLPDSVAYPDRQKAISPQAAAEALLETYPLQLYYVRTQDQQSETGTWKLIYDLSYRKSRSHCFCGAEEKQDLTVHVDAFSGKVMTLPE
jgi:hypothetical protein